jgi:hypothetical protein
VEQLLNSMQWPAMAVTVLATYLVASQHQGRRRAAFWCYLLSNLMWVAWGLHSGATALVVLQFCLAALNLRGAKKADADAEAQTG